MDMPSASRMSNSRSPNKMLPSTSKWNKTPKKKERTKRKDPLPTDLDSEQLKHFDELLEGATEKYRIPRRVSKAIVRNIIKSEESSTLLKVAAGIADPSELPAQKFTRSKTMLNVPLRPVEVASLANRPPNFLYVKDFGNDDDDVDYVEDQSDEESRSSSSSEECLEEENDEDEVERELKGLAEDGDDFFNNMQNWNSWQFSGQDFNLNSAANYDPLAETTNELLYPEWLLTDWNELQEDPDYNYEAEAEDIEDAQEKLENYTQKTVMSKRELKVLMADAYDLDKVQTMEEKRRLREEFKTRRLPRRDQKKVKTVVSMPDDKSCSLIKTGPYIFKQTELDQLQSQLEQHVQLLTQTILVCYHDDQINRTNVLNKYQTMFNELDSLDLKARNEKRQSMFNISNMAEAIASMHDVMSIPKVPNNVARWQNAPTWAGYFPRPEACLAMSRSKALLYPSLIPFVQPHSKKTRLTWTNIEDTLLLLGLIQFGYVSNSSFANNEGRYYQIHRNLLPTRTPDQIGDHLANLRKAPFANPLQKMILNAQDNNPLVKVENEALHKCSTTMAFWPKELKPCWYESFCSQFRLNGGHLEHVGNDPSLLRSVSPVRLPSDIGVLGQGNLLPIETMTPGGKTMIVPDNMTVFTRDKAGALQPINLAGKQLVIMEAPTFDQHAEPSIAHDSPETSARDVLSVVQKETTPRPPESVPDSDAFVDIEAVSEDELSEGNVNCTTQKTTKENRYTNGQNFETSPLKDRIEPESSSKSNRRKQSNPTRFIPIVRKRRSMIKGNSPSKKKKIEHLRDQLYVSSSESEDSNSPKKNVKTGLSSKKEKNTFEFQELSRDMPLLIPLEVDTECSNTFIPLTPGIHTPADLSDESNGSNELTLTPQRTCSRMSPPRTPRDDNVTQSPTLLRADTVMAKALFSKVTMRRNLFPTDFSNLAKSPTADEKVLSFVENSLPYKGVDIEGPSTSSMNCNKSPAKEAIPSSPTRKWRKRTRTEMAQDGLEGLKDPEHRRRQEYILCRHIFNDIRKRLLLRRDLYNQVQEVFKQLDCPTQIIMEVNKILNIDFPEVSCLIACLFPESELPLQMFANPMRKAYKEALDIIMAIDAYTMRAKYKSSKSSKLLFKLIQAFSFQDLSAEEFCNKIKTLLIDAPPLWRFIKDKLSAEFDEKMDEAQIEFLDMTVGPSLNNKIEFIDINRVLGPVPSKRRNKIHIHNGNLYVNNGNTYVIAEVEKPKFVTPVGRAPHSRVQQKKAPVAKKKIEPKWTKEYDLRIISAYNSVEEEDEDAVVESLLTELPFPKDKITERLVFLLSQFAT